MPCPWSWLQEKERITIHSVYLFLFVQLKSTLRSKCLPQQKPLSVKHEPKRLILPNSVILGTYKPDNLWYTGHKWLGQKLCPNQGQRSLGHQTWKRPPVSEVAWPKILSSRGVIYMMMGSQPHLLGFWQRNNHQAFHHFLSLNACCPV